MTNKWIGYTVSIDCGNVGTYQGQISSVDISGQSLTLKKAFKNGIPDQSQQVVVWAQDIMNLTIIDMASETADSNVSSSTIAVTKPIAKRPGRSISESLATVRSSQRESPRKPVDDSNYRSLIGNEGNRTPSKKDRQRQKWSEKDEACFGSPIDNIPQHDFDFEKNLALFNKQMMGWLYPALHWSCVSSFLM